MRFESEADVDRFLERFEQGEISSAEWTHGAHVAMAGAYVMAYGSDAFYRIRAGIHHLNWHNGVITRPERGYHETLTVFWTRILERFTQLHAGKSRAEILNLAIETLPVKLSQQYYSYDVVKSMEARQVWVEPDLKPEPSLL